jgi:hypothetical protein
VEYPSINLKKKGLNVSFINWEGEAPYEEFKEVWVNMEGILFKYLTWKVIAQVSSTIGVLVDVDWPVIFKSVYKKVRIKVFARDSKKKPPSKLFEFEQCLFHVKFDVEKPLDGGGDNEDDDDARDEAVVVDDDEELEDDFQEKLIKLAILKQLVWTLLLVLLHLHLVLGRVHTMP